MSRNQICPRPLSSPDAGPPRRRGWAGSALPSLLLAPLLLIGVSCGPPSTDGLVVTACPSWGQACRAGLREGDVLVAWDRREDAAAGGPLTSPLELLRVELEESPRGQVTVIASRGRRQVQVTAPAGRWGVETRPDLGAEELERLNEARDLLEAGKVGEAASRFASLAEGAGAAGRPEDGLWFRLLRAEGLAAANDAETGRSDDEVAEAFEGILGADAATTEGPLAALVFPGLLRQCQALLDAGRPSAEAACRRAVEAAPTDSLASAGARLRLGRALRRSRPEEAEAAAEQALEIYRRHPAAVLERASAHHLLGILLRARGDAAGAESSLSRAIELQEEAGAAGPAFANCLGALGTVALDKGDLRTALALHRRALTINEAVDPASVDTAYALNLVGVTLRRIGDPEAARALISRALEIFEEELPGGLEVAGMHYNLGNVASDLGELPLARDQYRRALEIRRRIQPGTPYLAASLHNLGQLARREGRYEESLGLLEEALALRRELQPRSRERAQTESELAFVFRELGRPEEAAESHRRALAAKRRLDPEDLGTATDLFGLGQLALDAGRPAEAETLWRRAVEVIESQRRRLGMELGDTSHFASRYLVYYRKLAELLVSRGRIEEAFDLLESARARGLRHLLAQRRVLPLEGVSAELAWEMRRLERTAMALEARLGRLDAEGDRERAAALRGHRERVRERLGEIQAEIRRVAPRFAALREAPPVDLATVRRALDPGTLLLSYSVGEDQVLLFAVSAQDLPGPPLTVHRLPLGEAALRQRVEVFRALIDRGRSRRGSDRALIEQGQRLYEDLLGPIAERAETAERLAVVAEGSLLDLPFGALLRPADDGGEELRPVAAWKPLVHAASGGVFAELAADRGAAETDAASAPDGPGARTGEAPLLVFADSRGGTRSDRSAEADAGGAGGDDAQARRAADLGPLPHARREAAGIAELFPGARVWLGEEATEATLGTALDALWRGGDGAASEVSGGTASGLRLHFAVHGLLDARFPLDSALVLSPVDGAEPETPEEVRDGLLHAWEVIERLRLDADLVTLSACESGPGDHLAGEGLLGLARAFQIAGARSLVVTQWRVSDRGTAELMLRFYRGLEAGRDKAAALAAAQAALAAGEAGEELAHPHHWAGVRLIGAPR